MVEPTTEIVRAPESPFNRSVLQALGDLDQALRTRTGYSPLEVSRAGVTLLCGGRELVRVTPSDIVAAGMSFQPEFGTPQPAPVPAFQDKFVGFLGAISGRLVRLNHLGVSYFPEDVDAEAQKIKHSVGKTPFSLYEEESGEPTQRWLFAGDTVNWEDPLFEMVLDREGLEGGDFWVPHVQIDIDTSLTLTEIRKITEQFLGEGFIRWEHARPDGGVDLVMGIFGQVNGSKIALGIGTDLRGTEPWYTEMKLLE